MSINATGSTCAVRENEVKGLALLLLLAAAGNSPGVAPELRYFRYQRTIQNLPPAAQQTCFAIDPSIFTHAAPQLADLRLYQGSVETPYALRLVAPALELISSLRP